MTDQVNIVNVAALHAPQLGITTSPKGASFTYPISGGGSYSAPSAYYTPIGQPITFIGSVTFYDINVIPVSWDWDFGDGNTGNGQTVLHRYIVANPYTQVVLKVTDSNGKYWATRQTMYLRSTAGIVISEGLPIVGPASAATITSTANSFWVSPAIQPVVASTNRIPGL